jgi:hypothetical protein
MKKLPLITGLFILLTTVVGCKPSDNRTPWNGQIQKSETSKDPCYQLESKKAKTHVLNGNMQYVLTSIGRLEETRIGIQTMGAFEAKDRYVSCTWNTDQKSVEEISILDGGAYFRVELKEAKIDLATNLIDDPTIKDEMILPKENAIAYKKLRKLFDTNK